MHLAPDNETRDSVAKLLTKVEESIAGAEKAPSIPKSSEETGRPYFSIGSTMKQVLAIQGTPSAISRFSSGDTWYYSYCSVEFTPSRTVRQYSNMCGSLHEKLKAEGLNSSLRAPLCVGCQRRVKVDGR